MNECPPFFKERFVFQQGRAGEFWGGVSPGIVQGVFFTFYHGKIPLNNDLENIFGNFFQSS